MKKNKCFLLLLFLFITFSSKVKAECSDSEISRLKKIANNVEYSYVFFEDTLNYTVYLTNTSNELVIKDITNDVEYNTDKEIKISGLSFGKAEFSITLKDTNCSKETFRTIYVELPYYNMLYKSEICKGIEDYKYCKKFLSSSYSTSTLTKNINAYRETLKEEKKEETKKQDTTFNKVIDYYIKYYYIVLPIVILILISIIVVDSKKNKIV